MAARRSLVLLLAALCITACVPRDFPYYVMILDGDIVPVEYGLPEDLNTRGVDEFPVRYELRRPGYNVLAAVDRSANLPTILFWATDLSGNSLAVTGQFIRCVAGFDPLLDNDPMKKKFPLAEQKFNWAPCRTAVIPEDAFQGDVVLEIQINDGSSIREVIPFRVVSNGTKRVYDSI